MAQYSMRQFQIISTHRARWFSTAINRDIGTGPLARPLVRLLAPLTPSLPSSWESVIFDVPFSSCFETQWTVFDCESSQLILLHSSDGEFPSNGDRNYLDQASVGASGPSMAGQKQQQQQQNPQQQQQQQQQYQRTPFLPKKFSFTATNAPQVPLVSSVQKIILYETKQR